MGEPHPAMVDKDLAGVRETWDRLASEDPMWAVLSRPEKRHGKWDEDEFFETGESFVEEKLAWVRSIAGELPNGPVLDFGCGLGRLTQPLSQHFSSAVGVDISATMIARAEAANRHGDRCTFFLNERSDLGAFDDASFGFVCTHIVLQHMPLALSAGYLREFMRVLRPGGLAFIQMNEVTRNPVLRLLHRVLPTEQIHALLKHRERAAFSMYGRDLEEAERILASAGGRVIGVATAPYGRWWLNHHVLVERTGDHGSSPTWVAGARRPAPDGRSREDHGAVADEEDTVFGPRPDSS